MATKTAAECGPMTADKLESLVAIEALPLPTVAPKIAAALEHLTGIPWRHEEPIDPATGEPYYHSAGVWAYLRTDTDAHGLTLYCEGGRHDRIEVSGNWPRDPEDGSTMSPTQYLARGELVEWRRAITVSRLRTPEAIAKDIARRFLPMYREVWERIEGKRTELTHEARAREMAGADLVRRYGGAVVQDRWRDSKGETLYEQHGCQFRTYYGREWYLYTGRDSSVLTIPHELMGVLLDALAIIRHTRPE